MIRAVCVLWVAFLCGIAGCDSGGPVPEEQATPRSAVPKVSTTETTGAHPGAANPHAGSNDPHAGMNIGGPSATAKPPAVDPDTGMLDIGAVAFRVPSTWTVETPKSSMRRAQLSATGSDGPAELVVFYFGPQGAGTTQDNVDRWVGQFTTESGSPVTTAEKTTGKAGDYDVSRVSVAGRYAGGMAGPGQAAAPEAGQRLLGAIVSTPAGPYYFKLLGPEATVGAHSAAFDGLLASIVASP